MRALVKLLCVAAVVALFALDHRIELAVAGACLLAVVACVIHRIDRHRPDRRVRRTQRVATPFDTEGRTVRAPLTAKEAAELHRRHAPVFDRELAIRRHQDRHGEERYAPAPHVPSFDQERYDEAYARIFDHQLSTRRHTMAYEVPTPKFEIARGSYTDGQYRELRSQTPRSRPPEPVLEPWRKPAPRRD